MKKRKKKEWLNCSFEVLLLSFLFFVFHLFLKLKERKGKPSWQGRQEFWREVLYQRNSGGGGGVGEKSNSKGKMKMGKMERFSGILQIQICGVGSSEDSGIADSTHPMAMKNQETKTGMTSKWWDCYCYCCSSCCGSSYSCSSKSSFCSCCLRNLKREKGWKYRVKMTFAGNK